MPRPFNPNVMSMQLRIDKDIHNKVRSIAQRESRSVNMMICHIVAQYVESYERKNGKITTEE